MFASVIREPRLKEGSMAQLADQSSGSPALAAMLAEHAEIERELADPAVHADQGRARALGRRYAELTQVAEVVARPRRHA